jgi:hypothetical protein
MTNSSIDPTRVVLERIAIKLLSEDDRMSLILSEGRVAYLLTEEIDDQDIADLKDVLTKTREQFDKLDANLRADGLDLSKVAGVDDYLVDLKKALDNAQKSIADLELGEDAEGIAAIARKYWGQESDAEGITRAVMAVQARAAQFKEALTGGIKRVLTALADFKDLKKDEPIGPQGGEENIPEAAKILTAFDDAFKQAVPEEKGFFGRLMQMFNKGKGLEDKVLDYLRDPDFKALSKALMAMSYNQLAKISKTLEDQPTSPAPSSGAVSDVSDAPPPGGGAGAPAAAGEAGGGAATVGGGGAGSEGPGGGEAGAPAGAPLSDILFQQIDPEDKGQGFKLGEYDPGTDEAEQVIGLENLATTLKDLAAKPNNKNRKNFIKHLNKMIGKNTFESVGNLRVPMLSEVLLSTNKPRGLKSPSQDYDLGSDRWLKLAGLEEE